MELGGKSPLIIFSDCELDKAVRMVRVPLCSLHHMKYFSVMNVVVMNYTAPIPKELGRYVKRK